VEGLRVHATAGDDDGLVVVAVEAEGVAAIVAQDRVPVDDNIDLVNPHTGVGFGADLGGLLGRGEAAFFVVFGLVFGLSEYHRVFRGPAFEKTGGNTGGNTGGSLGNLGGNIGGSLGNLGFDGTPLFKYAIAAHAIEAFS
jgi:hypothetical protein